MCQLKDCGKNPLGLYRVQEGDTLQSVCTRFALPPALVAARNGAACLSSAGALLLLPDVRGKTYTVCAGETLAAVCEKFGLTEESFCRMNAWLVRLSDAARSRGGGVGLALSQSGGRASYIGL